MAAERGGHAVGASKTARRLDKSKSAGAHYATARRPCRAIATNEVTAQNGPRAEGIKKGVMTQGTPATRPRAPQGAGYLQTTAGDWEIEAKSRRYNALEAIGLYTFLMVVQWPFCYLLGTLADNEAVKTFAWYPVIAGAVYLLLASPFIHKDSLESWGLGNPKTLWRLLHSAPSPQRAMMGVTILGILAGLNYANFTRWHEVSHFFSFDDIANVLGYDRAAVDNMVNHFPGQVFVVCFGTAISLLIVGFGIRYDNFGSAFKTAMMISVPLFIFTCISAYTHRGLDAFKSFHLTEFVVAVLGYLFWGFTQQLLFSSYFGTRLRKGFGPSTAPHNVIPVARRLQVTLIGGAVLAALVAPSAYLAVTGLYGPDALAPVSMLYFAAFSFPFGALYGYFFCLDKRRLLVATLTASFFGFIHIESYGLVAVTFMLGIVLIYVFMEDKNRNLVALGFVHGLMGSTFGWLFSRGESGALEVDYSVGPWNVDDPTWPVVIFPVLCILFYIGVMVWCARNLPSEKPAQV